MQKYADMDFMPLRWGHYRVLIIASLGQFLGSALTTLVGVILPLIRLASHDGLSSFQLGFIGTVQLIGIMFGSLLFGRLSDKYGYLLFFRVCPALVLIASLCAYFWSDIFGLDVCLFLMGLGVGGEYALDPDYISEIMPDKYKLTMVGIAKAFSALGSFLMAGVAFLLLRDWGDPVLWHRLLLTVSVLSAVIFLSRIRFGESPGWLLAHGKVKEAERMVRYFLGDDVVMGKLTLKQEKSTLPKGGLMRLFRHGNYKKIILTGFPWACQGVGAYGIGVFIPILILVLGLEPDSESHFTRILDSVRITAYISVFNVVGFVIGLWLVSRCYHIRIQAYGFFLASCGLILLLIAYLLHWPAWIAIAGFMFFEVFLNAGPNLMTFILPTEIYDVSERGSGCGLSAAIGKIGAIASVMLIPYLLHLGGGTLVLIVTIAANFLGGAITWFMGRRILPPSSSHKRLKSE